MTVNSYYAGPRFACLHLLGASFEIAPIVRIYHGLVILLPFLGLSNRLTINVLSAIVYPFRSHLIFFSWLSGRLAIYVPALINRLHRRSLTRIYVKNIQFLFLCLTIDIKLFVFVFLFLFITHQMQNSSNTRRNMLPYPEDTIFPHTQNTRALDSVESFQPFCFSNANVFGRRHFSAIK